MPVYDALMNHTDSIDHILVRHEQGATHAAQGYARASGKVGVCMVTGGPGATNTITGIADAMLDSTPIVVIAGQITTDLIGTDAFQEVDSLPEGYSVPEGREKPWGTAHAVLCAKPFIDEPFAVINADDYYGIHAYQVMADFLISHPDQSPAPFAMVGYLLGNTVTDNGYVSRGICEVDDSHQLISITERTHIEKREDHAEFTEDDGVSWTPLSYDTLVSMNFFGFQPMIMNELEQGFPKFLDQALSENPLKGEYYIPSAASDLIACGKATMEVLVSEDQWYGVTYPEDKQNVMDALQALKDKGLYPQEF